MSDLVTHHRRACNGFSAIVARGADRWTDASPCPGWDAGAVVEHVVGVHDDLLFRPAGVEVARPEHDPGARWAATVAAIDSALAMHADLDAALAILVGEVVTHTWDLGEALGIDAALDAELCAWAGDFFRAHEEQVRSSGVFAPELPVSHDADATTRLLAFLGRDVTRTLA